MKTTLNLSLPLLLKIIQLENKKIGQLKSISRFGPDLLIQDIKKDQNLEIQNKINIKQHYIITKGKVYKQKF